MVARKITQHFHFCGWYENIKCNDFRVDSSTINKNNIYKKFTSEELIKTPELTQFITLFDDKALLDKFLDDNRIPLDNKYITVGAFPIKGFENTYLLSYLLEKGFKINIKLFYNTLQNYSIGNNDYIMRSMEYISSKYTNEKLSIKNRWIYRFTNKNDYNSLEKLVELGIQIGKCVNFCDISHLNNKNMILFLNNGADLTDAIKYCSTYETHKLILDKDPSLLTNENLFNCIDRISPKVIDLYVKRGLKLNVDLLVKESFRSNIIFHLIMKYDADPNELIKKNYIYYLTIPKFKKFLNKKEFDKNMIDINQFDMERKEIYLTY